MTKTVIAFKPGSGRIERLVRSGLLEKDGRTITERGIEVLAVHGVASPQSVQIERVAMSSILAALSDGPARMHELPGSFVEKSEKLMALKAKGLVVLTDGAFSLTADGVAAVDKPASNAPVGRKRVKRPPDGQVRVTLSFDGVLKPGDRTDGDRWAVLSGDVLERLRALPDGCVDLVIYSPPYYKYRDYGEGQMGNEDTPELYVQGQLAVLRELMRVLSSRGLVWCVIQDKLEGGRLYGVVHDLVSESKKIGVILADEAVWAKDTCLANSSGRSLTMSHESILVFAKTMDYYWSGLMARETGGRGMLRNAQSVQRFPHSKQPWQEGHDAVFPPEFVQFALRCSASFHGRCRCGELWEDELTVEARGEDRRRSRMAAQRRVVGAAPRCGHAGDPEPLLILDPFSGSGTTGMVSLAHGRARFLGIENKPKFFAMSARNLGEISPERS